MNEAGKVAALKSQYEKQANDLLAGLHEERKAAVVKLTQAIDQLGAAWRTVVAIENRFPAEFAPPRTQLGELLRSQGLAAL